MSRKLVRFMCVLLTALLLPFGSHQVASSAEPKSQVEGTVLRVDGSPATGAQVLATAMPMDAPLFHVETPLGSADVDDEGKFSITLDVPSTVAAVAEENDDYVNVRLTAIDQQTTGAYVTHWVTYIDLEDPAVEPAEPPALRFTDNFDELALPEEPQASSRSAIPGVSQASSSYYIPIVDCYIYNETVGTATQATKSGELHSYSYMTAKWTYGNTADSEIEVAVRADGGSYTGGGFAAVRNSVANSVSLSRSDKYGRQLKLNFKYVKERVTTLCPLFVSQDETIRATQWAPYSMYEGLDVSGGDGPAAANANIATRDCLLPGQSVTKVAGKGYLYSNSVSVFGVSLRSTNGYSTNLTSVWKAGTSKRNYFLFGTDSKPETARVVYTSSDAGLKPPDCTA